MTVPARTPGPGQADAAPAPGTPDPAVALVVPPLPEELVAGALATWRADLVELAGGSTLEDVELLGEAALDLSAAHPSGMAQLFAGRSTRLSSLVREGGAAATARRRARAVSSRAAAFAQRWGIAPTYLAIGVATWTEHVTAPSPGGTGDDLDVLASAVGSPGGPAAAGAGAAGAGAAGASASSETAAGAGTADGGPRVRVVRAPVLLRPVTLRPRGTAESDHELALEPAVELNPVLARALRRRGALLDPAAVARGTFEGGRFDARPALTRVAALGAAVLDDFALTERVLVGAFVHPGQVLVDDLDALAPGIGAHEVLAALAGVEGAAAALRRPLPAPVPGDRDPGAERGVGDLDPAQQHVLDVVASGAHAFVDAPAGSDVTGTVAAVVADAAASGRTVLYVPGHRRSAAALAARLDALGVGDLLLDVGPDAGWRATACRRLLGALTLDPPAVDADGLAGLRAELVAHRERLRASVAGLHAVRDPWGVSAYDALQELARLTGGRPVPRTTVRLPHEVARGLDAGRRAALGADLQRAGRLQAFTLRPADTPWYGADLRTAADAEVARHRLERLLGSGLPVLVERTAAVAAETGLTRATTLDEWGEQLRVLDGIRASLDVFVPLVFERTAADLVAATAPKAWRERHGVAMGLWVRRRLRKQARDLVRPGRPVADLHAALVEVQAQRETWQAHCPGGGWPRLPDGLSMLEEEHAGVRADVDALAAVLATTPEGGDLGRTPLPELVARLERLRAATDALALLPERTTVLHRLRAAGLGDLVDDLAARRASPDVAPAELDLAWWSTVFEGVLAQDPALAGYDGAALGALAARYAALDRSHVAALARPVLAAVVGHVRDAVARHPQQVESLFAELVDERLTSLRDTVERHPDVAPRLRPVVAASPMLVPQVLPPGRHVDLVVLEAGADLRVEFALPALARGRQVVVVGDARCAGGSAVAELAALLPTVAIPADASRRDPYLTAFLARHGYGGVLRPTPLPSTEPLVHLEVVDGTGMPDAATGTVQSPVAEVERVVDLVIHHALARPGESLAVVTASAVHAERVAEAVLAEVRENPALGAFFDPARPEPFVVTDLANVAGLRREAVVLSLGLGRTPHRRVLHRFGPVSAPGGERLLLDALGATRRRLTVVSCFAADDLDPHRTRGPGARLLRDLLAMAAERAAGGTPLTDPPAPDEDAAATDHPDLADPRAPEAAHDHDGSGRTEVDGREAVAPVGPGAGTDAGTGAGPDASAAAGSGVHAGTDAGTDAGTGAVSDVPAAPQSDAPTAGTPDRGTADGAADGAAGRAPAGRRDGEAPADPDDLAALLSGAPRAPRAPRAQDEARARTRAPSDEARHRGTAAAADRLVLDLADRLWRHGLTVVVDHGIPGGTRIPLAVGHPDVPDRLLVAVLTDDAAYVAQPSVRVRDRQVVERLERLGWSVVRVWSAAAFLDPEGEVDRIRRAVHALVPVAPEAPVVPVTGALPALVEDEPVEELPAPDASTEQRPATGTPAPAAPAVPPSTDRGEGASAAEPPAGPPDDPGPGAGAVLGDGAAPDAGGSAAVLRDAAPSPTGHPDEGSDATRAEAGRAAVRPATAPGPATPGPGTPGLGTGWTSATRGTSARRASAPVDILFGGATPAHDAGGDAPDAAPQEPTASPAGPDAAAPAGAPEREGEGEGSPQRRLQLVGPAPEGPPERALPRPDVRPGLPISAYSDDQLDDLVAWLRSDGVERSREELATLVREELGVARRSFRIDSAVRAAIVRALS
ncbi:hypothetical protein [Cellulomonas endophytica]|uniref:hypothetical protein n=1 Tax=Cellulomonas endophytica TaxID=2494735 RepID=UPI001F0C3CB2|nr:hypothetical protein [Cellulomonas endophytica]